MPACPSTTLIFFPLAQRCLQKITHCKGRSGEVLGTLQGIFDKKQYSLSKMKTLVSWLQSFITFSSLLLSLLASEVPGGMLGTEQFR